MIDIFLLAVLVWTAWAAIASSDVFRCTVAFMVFGLLMALVWAWLGAIDLAIAEAAVGAGVTGGLFLTTLKRFHQSSGNHV